MRAIWGDSAFRDPRGIDVHVRHLREKLEAAPERPELILTVRGAGYRLARVRAPGLRARLVLALFATAATTLAVAALALLPPLERRLRDDAARTLTLRAEAARPGFERLQPHAEPGRLLRALARATGAQVVLVDAPRRPRRDRPRRPRQPRRRRPRRSPPAATSAPSTAGSPRPRSRCASRAGRPRSRLRRRLGDVGRTYSVVADAFAGAALAGLALALIGGFALSGRMLRRLQRA